ncbi:hypothetical protein D3C76_154560 [compost metagenome]
MKDNEQKPTNPADEMLESRSATKSLIFNPRPLSESEYGEPQRWKKGMLKALEYRIRILDLYQERLRFKADPKHNRRRYNSTSLSVKVHYARVYAAMEGTRLNEGREEKVVESMFHLREKPKPITAGDMFLDCTVKSGDFDGDFLSGLIVLENEGKILPKKDDEQQ